MSGTVYAAANGGPDHYPAGSALSGVRVMIVDGVNTGRETSSFRGSYTLADLEPGTMTLQFSTSGYVDLRRTEEVRADTMLDVRLEPGPWPGFVLSGLVTTQWGEPIWEGTFRLRAVKTGYVPAEVSIDVLSPGSRGVYDELPAPFEVRQDFLLQRMGSC